MNSEVRKILCALIAGEQIERFIDGMWVQMHPEGTLRTCAAHIALPDGTAWGNPLRVKPPAVTRFIPVHRMGAGSIVMAEAKAERWAATEPGYNGLGASEKQVGVLHVRLDPDTLELVSAMMEKLP